MTTATFFQQFDQNTQQIQGLAYKLTEDFDAARFLYLETAHQAMKHKKHLRPDKFEEWLIATMKKTYHKFIHRKP